MAAFRPVPADISHGHAHLAGDGGAAAHREGILVQELADGKAARLPVGILVRIVNIEFLLFPVGNGVAEDGAPLHVAFEIEVRDRGAAAIGHHLVPEPAGKGSVQDHDLLVRPGALARGEVVVLAHTAHQFPVPGMGIQEHHGRGTVVEGVELVDVVDLADVLPDELLPALFAAATGEPDGLGKEFSEMDIELLVDVLDRIIILVRETAGNVREYHVVPIAEHVPHEPGDEPSPGIVVCERQPRMEPQERLHGTNAE